MDRLHGLFTASVDRDPHKVAFLTRASRHTYGELHQRAARFAGALAAEGIGPGDRVALVLDATVDYLVCFYGALMAGAVAVPLCSDTRTGPLVHALSYSGSRAVVLDVANLRWLEGQSRALPGLTRVFVRGDGSLNAAGNMHILPFEAALEAANPLEDRGRGDHDLAALMFTSGTTGRSKAVMLSHRNLVSNTRSIIEYLSLTADDVAGMVLPFFYVYGSSVLHTHLAVGGSIAPVGSVTFVAQVLEGLSTLRCTGLAGVPATFLRLLSRTSFEEYDLSGLRYMTQAGAAMPPQLIEKLRLTFPRTQVFVMYGQTEAAARLAYVPPDQLEAKLGSAGKAIPGVTLKICDAEGNELPRGEVGEVVAQGPNIMLGYYENPEANARVLRPEGLRTGDIGCMDADGYLFLQGRESELIKSGGHRISPFDIEDAMARTPGVRECAVGGVPDEMLGELVVAYVVPDAGLTLTKRAVLDACFHELPKFKMPALIYAVDELPRGPTGKVQRRMLREWHAQGRGTKLT